MYTILRKTNNKRFRNIWKNDKKSLLFQILIELWAFRKKKQKMQKNGVAQLQTFSPAVMILYAQKKLTLCVCI